MAHIILEEEFYPGEGGFAFSIKTGIDLTGLLEGEIKGVIKRPNSSVVYRTIPLAKIADVATGTVYFDILSSDFTVPGEYKMQIFAKDADGTLTRPSHVVSFTVASNLVSATTVFV